MGEILDGGRSTFPVRIFCLFASGKECQNMEKVEPEVDWILERVHVPGHIILRRNERSYTCGRGKDNQIVCLSLLVSRRHCIFIRAEGGLSIIDLGSSNGVYVNGVPQPPNVFVKLHENDVIGVGCPDVDVMDPTMFLYRLRRVNLDPHINGVNADNLSKTLVVSDCNSKNDGLNIDRYNDQEWKRPSALTKRKSSREMEDSCKVAKLDLSSVTPNDIKGALTPQEDDVEILFSSPSGNNESKVDDSHTIASRLVSGGRNDGPDGNEREQINQTKCYSEKKNLGEVEISIHPTTSTSSTKVAGKHIQLSSSTDDAQVSIDSHQPRKKKSKSISTFKGSDQLNKPKVLHMTNFVNEISISGSPVKNPSPDAVEAITMKSKPNTLPNGDCVKIWASEVMDTLNFCKENQNVRLNNDNRKKITSKKNRQKDAHNIKLNCRLRDWIPTVDKNVSDVVTSISRDRTSINTVKSDTHEISEKPHTSNNVVCHNSVGNTLQSSNTKKRTSDRSAHSHQSPNIYNEVVSEFAMRSVSMEIEKLNEKTATECVTLETPETSSNMELKFKLGTIELQQQKEKKPLTPTAWFVKLEDNHPIESNEIKPSSSPSGLGADIGQNSSPMKLKPIKQEPTTRFSMNDIVDLSDDEDDIFPCSQLFDFNNGLDPEESEESKHDVMETIPETDLDEIEEIISLSDSEDEDNVWLQRLSRSQILIEDDDLVKVKSPNFPIKREKTVGECIGTDERNDKLISNVIFDESSTAINVPDVDSLSINKANESIIPTTTQKSKVAKNEQTHREENASELKLQEMAKVDAIELTKVSSSGSFVNVYCENDKLGKLTLRRHTDTGPKKVAQKMPVERHSIGGDVMDIPDGIVNRTKVIMALMSGRDEEKIKETPNTDTPKTAKPNTKKAPLIINPPFLPKGERRSVSCGNQNLLVLQQSVASTSKISDKVESDTIAKSMSPPKLTAKQKKEFELKAKIERKQYETEQKLRRLKNKFANCVPPIGKKKALNISKEQKLEIISDRKEKLKKLAVEQKLIAEKMSPVERVVTKPKAKVTMKSRGDFLVSEQTVVPSKRSLSTDRSFLTTTDSSKPSIVNGNKHSKDDCKNVNESGSSTRASRSQKNTSIDIFTMQPPSASKDTHPHGSIELAVEVPRESLDKNVTAKTRKATMAYKITKKSQNTKPVAASVTQLSDNLSNLSTAEVAKAENQLPNALYKKQPHKKKRVSFNDNLVSVRAYEIDAGNSLNKFTGKDAPIPHEKLRPKANKLASQCRKLEEFLLKIFSWNPIWLEEQRRLKTQPPVVSEEALIPLLTSYNTYEEYYRIIMPLLLLELWQGITKEFETIEKNQKRPTVICTIVNNSLTSSTIPPINKTLTTMMLEVLATKQEIERQVHPIYGDLVFLELVSNVNQDGRQNFQKVFAYVTNVHQTVITPNTHYNADLKTHVRNPHTVLTYTVMTRQLHMQVHINRVQRLRSITYLRSDMRMVQALQYLPASPIVDLVLSPKTDTYQLPKPPKQQSYHLVTRDRLNTKQLEAVLKTTESIVRKEAKICLIQGPPGTGKSKVIVNMVMQVMYGDNRYKNNRAHLRILLCAPSNAAIDEIVLRLLEIRATLKHDRFKMVRVGRPATMHPSVKDISVPELARREVKRTVSNCQANGLSIDSIEEEKRFLEARMNALQTELSSRSIDVNHSKYIRVKVADMKAKYDLLKNRNRVDEMNPRELSKLQRAAENSILAGADIVACTLASCYTNQMESIFGGNKERISACIVDEATQSCEAETLIPLMLGVNTLVLVGDPNQLPATVISQKAKKLGLDQSLFSRIQNAFEGQKNNPIIMLDTQYRMDYPISYWPNKFYYAGRLKNALSKRPVFPFQSYKILNLDSNQNSDKFSNTREAEFVANMLSSMMSHTDLHTWQAVITVGVITPYQNQRSLIESKINERMASLSVEIKSKVVIEVNTVDSFQGRERDIIIMSCVRSHGIGFLADRQRLCVALTRAKYSLLLCGKFGTFQKDDMWNALLADAKSRGVFVNMRADAKATEIIVNVCRSKSKTHNGL